MARWVLQTFHFFLKSVKFAKVAGFQVIAVTE
jgi:hypothetical protein